jgi:hypothetical protein
MRITTAKNASLALRLTRKTSASLATDSAHSRRRQPSLVVSKFEARPRRAAMRGGRLGRARGALDLLKMLSQQVSNWTLSSAQAGALARQSALTG